MKQAGKGWRHRYGAWYYRVPKAQRHLFDDKTEYKLGDTLDTAWATYNTRTAPQPEPSPYTTYTDLLTRYRSDVMPGKAWKSQESNEISAKRIENCLGTMPIDEIKTHHVAQYRDHIAAKHGATSAKRDLELISHTYTKAMEWGLTEHRPRCQKPRTPPRDRYVEDWEIAEFLKITPDHLTAYLWLKLATGQRRKDLLSLTLDDIRPDSDGIRIKPSKTANTSARVVLILWTEELQQWRDYALNIRPNSPHPHVFLNTRGQPWIKANGTANGFDTLWGRAQRQAIKETGLNQRFQEKDIRAKTASDTDLQHASALLNHTSQEITRIVYRRKGNTTEPHSTGRLFTKKV